MSAATSPAMSAQISEVQRSEVQGSEVQSREPHAEANAAHISTIGTVQLAALHDENGHISCHLQSDILAQEVPVALVFNGISHAVMLCSPHDLEDFARGFALSEGIVAELQEIYEIEVIADAGSAASCTVAAIEVRIEISSAAFQSMKEKRRALAGRTGCGLCGVESLAAFALDVPLVQQSLALKFSTILQAQRDMRQAQVLNLATGALHAAAWVSLEGEILLLREDVGRHNALDKLIGALALQKSARVPGFCLLTSRASYELVQKAARAQMPVLATVSAPTALAVQLAQQAGICLLGFVREKRANIYTHTERIMKA